MATKQTNLSKRLLETERDNAANIQYWLEKFCTIDDGYMQITQTFVPDQCQSSALEPVLGRDLLQMSHGKKEAFLLLLFVNFAILVSKYTGQRKFILGAFDFSNPEDRRTLPVYVSIDAGLSFKDLVKAIRAQYLESAAHSGFPMTLLFEKLPAGERDRFFAGCFGMQDDELISTYAINAPLFFGVEKNGEGWQLRLRYAMDLNIDALHFLHHFTNIARQTVSDPGRLYKDLCLLDEENRLRVFSWGKGSDRELADEHILDAWVKRVQEAPDRMAIDGAEGSMTYREFYEWTEGIACYLRREFGIIPKQVIAIRCDRGLWLVGLAFATLRLGCTFVGIDTRWPEERVLEVLKDSRATLLVSQTKSPINWKHGLQWTISVAAKAFSFSGKVPDLERDAADIAYMIYTSGTTGRPKGIPISNRSFMNMISAQVAAIGAGGQDRILQFASLSFDASVYEIFMALLSGACLVTLTNELVDGPDEFGEFLQSRGVTMMLLPPVYLSQLKKDRLRGLKTLLVGGDFPVAGDLRELSLAGVCCYNAYGPAELAVIAGTHRVMPDEEVPIPIGRPLDNTSWYILDQHLNPVPAGLRGELYIGGVGVGGGYHELDELTAAKYVVNPFGQGRLYRTGDKAYWRGDGLAVLAGRMDEQVKVRGQLVEPREIHLRLERIPGVKDVCVFANREGEAGAVIRAFYTVNERTDAARLIDRLRESLPYYMLPSSLEEVAEIPLTASGKPDKKALLDSLFQKAADRKQRAAYNGTEADLQEAWRDVLGKTIRVNDHFVREGGDSIKVIQFCSRLKEKGYQLSVRDVFMHPTIEELALQVSVTKAPADNAMVEGVIPLSPIQRVFFGLRFSEPWHFNQAAILKLNDNWSPDIVRSAFSRLLHCHDALRISFHEYQDGYLQENRAWPVPVDVNVYDYRERSDVAAGISETSAKNQASLRLDNSPLVRVDYYLTQSGVFLGVIIHHLVMDAISWGILLEDLDRLLKCGPGEAVLPDKTVSWKKWCEALSGISIEQKFFQGNRAERLPRMKSSMENTVGNTARVFFSLDSTLTRQLDEEVHHRYRTTVQDFVLAAFVRSVFEIWDMDGISMDLETHGRQVISGLDTGRTIGWFTAFYPVDFQRIGRDIDEEDLIVDVKEAIRRGQALALQHTMTYAEKGMAGGAAILFNYLGKTASRKFDSFSWSGIAPGATQSPVSQRMYDWEVNALIRDGKLMVNLDYCPGHFEQGVMEKLMSVVKLKLTSLIRRFQGQREVLLTPSDVILGDPGKEQLLEWQRNRSLEDIYPLTPMQEGMYYHFLSEREAGFYSTQAGYTLRGAMQVEKFERAYRSLVKRHSVLRSLFLQDKSGKPWQLVLRDPRADLTIEDIRHMEMQEAQRHIRLASESERRKGFDLANELSMRVRFFVLSDREFHVIWSYHHIVMDGWCMSILLSEWMKLYRDEVNGVVGFTVPAAPYRKYIEWLGKKDVEASYTWWLGILKGYSGDTRIPDSGRAAAIDKTARKSKGIQISEQRTMAIRRLAADWNVTLYVLVQGIWGIILGKYTQSSDLVFGSVVSGRPSDLDGVESMVGLFINNIPVRIRLNAEESFADLVRRLQAQSIEAESHQYCSLTEIQSRVPGNPILADHILLFENYPHYDELGPKVTGVRESEALKITGSHVFDINNYSFTLVILPGEKLRIKIDFNPQVHAEELIDDILICFDELFHRFEQNRDWKIAEIGRLPQQLQKKLLDGGNGGAVFKTGGHSVIGQLEQSIGRYGERLAVSSPDGEYTYRQLDERSRRLAYSLRSEYGVVSGEVVALHMERSGLAFPGIVGILRAGAAYVPVDPGWPAERKEQIFREAGVRVAVSLFGHLPELAGLGCEVLALDIQSEYGGESEQLPDCMASPDDMAYMIYTSGSTGRSKGVKISHRSNVNMALDQIRHFGVGSEDRVLQFAPLFFDASVYEWSIAFYSGATLFIPDERCIRNPELFKHYLESNKISMMTLPPPFFNLLPLSEMVLPRVVVLAGSSPDKTVTMGALGASNVYNAYGPTECAVCASIHRVVDEDQWLKKIPIGRPLSGNSIYLLDAAGELVPMGADGEICVSGINVGMGYAGDDAGYGSVFTDDPFRPGVKMYRTGDMARWLPGFLLEFRERKDRQIKVRGHRIEPAEVEAVIRQLSFFESVIVGEEKGNAGLSKLVAWVVTDRDWNETTVKQFLRERLPAYMVPDEIFEIDHLPMTPNGKVDSQQLKKMVNVRAGRWEATPPANTIEHKLYEIWKSVLSKSDFGIHDQYFEIGGNSLSLIRVNAQVKELYNKVSITDMFNYTTISEMAEYIASLGDADLTHIVAGIPVKDRQITGAPTAILTDAANAIIAGPEWDLIKEGMALPKEEPTDEEVIMAFFCFALYEVTESAVIKMVMLDRHGKEYRGLVIADFDNFDCREELVSHIIQANKNIKDAGVVYPLSGIRLEKSPDEIVVACSFDGMEDPEAIPAEDIDVLLTGGITRNGDLRISLVHCKRTIGDRLAGELLSRIIHIARNLVNS